MTTGKTAWRRELRLRRRAIDAATAEQAAVLASDHLCASPLWHNASDIALYLAADGEMPTRAIAARGRRDGKRLYLPVIDAKTLHFRLWREDEALIANRFGIAEPGPQAQTASKLQLMLMPLVGWSPGGFRLGMGGGFYDRYLASAERPDWCVGLAFECQGEPALEALREPLDEDMDAVLTEQQLRMLRSAT